MIKQHEYCALQRRILILFLAYSITPTYNEALSSLAPNDPFPMYTAIDPQEYLYTRQKLKMIGVPLEIEEPQTASIDLSPFGENAIIARNQQNSAIPIGDLNGRWNMVGLLYGPLPNGLNLTPTLQTAFEVLFPNDTPGDLNDPQFIDKCQQLGFFTIPLEYRKRGIRFQFETKLFGSDFGLQFQAGVADICQYLSETCELIKTKTLNTDSDGCSNTTCCTQVPCPDVFCPEKIECGICVNLVPGFHNLTCDACTTESSTEECTAVCAQVCPPVTVNSDFSKDNINHYLMCELCQIARELGLNIETFHKVSGEDIRFNLFWRHAHYVNKGREGWAPFLLTPYFEIGGSIATGRKRDPNVAFGLPFGNNGHDSVGGLFGIELDFVTSLTFGAQAGYTHFFDKTFCNYPVPTSCFQSGIYPFKTDVCIAPGANWHFGGKFLAYHFLERLSFYFQYLWIHHEEDSVKLTCPDPAFQPKILEDLSSWKVQLANVSFAYDISPNLALGFLWQTPITQQRAYRTTTLLFTLHATF
jgi:hypothetical protein